MTCLVTDHQYMFTEATRDTGPAVSPTNQDWTKQAVLWAGFHSGRRMEFLTNTQYVAGSSSSRTVKLSEEFPISH